MFSGLAWTFKLLPSKHTEASILSHKIVKVEGNDSVRWHKDSSFVTGLADSIMEHEFQGCLQSLQRCWVWCI